MSTVNDDSGDTPFVRLAVGWEAAPLSEDLSGSVPCLSSGREHPASVDERRVSVAGGCGWRRGRGAGGRGRRGCAPGEGPRAQFARVARDAVAVITHPSSSLAQLPDDDLQALFAGEIVDWSVLEAGVGRPVLAVQTRGASARQVFDAVLLQDEPVSSDGPGVPQ